MATIIRRPGPQGTVYRVQIRRKGHPSLSATFTTKTEARKWAKATEGDIHSGKQINKPPAQHTLAEAIDRYLIEVLPHKRPSTQPGQARQLRWWRKRLGRVWLEDVTPAMSRTREVRGGTKLPTELIDRSLLMGHKHLASPPVELRQVFKTAPRSNHLFHAPPEAFNRIERVTAVGR